MTVIILLLLLVYLTGCVFQTKQMDILQKITIYGIHFLGFLCLFRQEPKLQMLVFYLLQVLLISILLIGFRLWRKSANALLNNHIGMFFAIGMTVLMRLSLAQAFRQLVFWGIGICILFLFSYNGKYTRLFRRYPAVYALFGILLLGTVVIVGATSYGAKLNLSIGGITFQPSEFVKLIFILFVAAMLSKAGSTGKLLLTCGISAVFVLLLVASRDLGGALLYFVTFVMMFYAATGKRRYLGIGSIGLVLAAVAGYFLFSHVQTRVFAWLTPLADFNNRGYQICQSLFGIGTGGWFGLGIGKGNPSLIPIVEKDFIFSAISEEFGAVFAIGLIVLTLSTFLTMMRIAENSEDIFYRLTVIGIASLYAAQVILTIGGAMKFIPSTGVTLPFVSYGGSSLCASAMLMGMVLRVSTGEEKNEKEVPVCKVVAAIFAVILAVMILYFVYFMIFESPVYVYSEYNKLLR